MIALTFSFGEEHPQNQTLLQIRTSTAAEDHERVFKRLLSRSVRADIDEYSEWRCGGIRTCEPPRDLQKRLYTRVAGMPATLSWLSSRNRLPTKKRARTSGEILALERNSTGTESRFHSPARRSFSARIASSRPATASEGTAGSLEPKRMQALIPGNALIYQLDRF